MSRDNLGTEMIKDSKNSRLNDDELKDETYASILKKNILPVTNQNEILSKKVRFNKLENNENSENRANAHYFQLIRSSS